MNGELIKKLREAKGETQLQMAVALGVTPGTVSMWERGTSDNPRVETAKRIAEHIGCSLDDLLKE